MSTEKPAPLSSFAKENPKTEAHSELSFPGTNRENILNRLSVVLWASDKEGNFTYLNSYWTQLTGQLPEEGYGTGWLRTVHPDDFKRVSNEFRQAIKKEALFTLTFPYKSLSGSYALCRLNGNPLRNRDGTLNGYLGGMQEIGFPGQPVSRPETADPGKKEKPGNDEQMYHRMVSEVQDYAILLLDKEGFIQNWNKGAEKIKGYRAQEIVGRNFRVFYPEDDQRRGLPEQLLGESVQKGSALHEGWRVRKDGSLFWGNVLITALHDEQNNIIGFSKVTRDLTERKLAEDDVKRKTLELEKKNEELAAFAYVAGHDLQEPLRKIQVYSDHIFSLEADRLSENGKELFSRIRTSTHRMRALIHDLLAYSRLNTAETQAVKTDLTLLLQEVLAELSDVMEEKRVQIEFTSLPTVSVIPFQIRQLFVNLLMNSIRFSKKDDYPFVKVAADSVSGSQLKDTGADAGIIYHHVSFSDNGIGFESQYSKRIFEVFQRLHSRNDYEGTGVGLAICKKIMMLHEGFITAEGKINEGAVFHLYFPMH